MPSDALLAKIVKRIDGFVAKGCLEEGPIRPLIHMPSKAVESLPWPDMGGVQRVDTPAQVQALQAKVAAMLLHPRRHAWKVLMQRAFQPGTCQPLGLQYLSATMPRPTRQAVAAGMWRIGGISHG
jgi:hypothetical protein